MKVCYLQCQDTSEEDSVSEDSSDASDSESDSESSEDDSEEEAPPKKRKAEAEHVPAPKKARTEIVDEGIKNLFVGHLSYNVDDEWLSREFESFGEMTRSQIMLDKTTGQSRG